MEERVGFLDDSDRLKIYERIVQGCEHHRSKGKAQTARFLPVLEELMVLADEDPYFLAHLNSYCATKSKSKDLKILTTFANSLSDADGTPFSEGSKHCKPNVRKVAIATVLLTFSPKEVLRLLVLANTKMKIGKKTDGTHFSGSLRKGIKKWISYREAHLHIMEGIRKAGLAGTMKNIYRHCNYYPSPEAAEILKWKQKDGSNADMAVDDTFDFDGLSDIQVAEKIRANRLRPQAVLGALPERISPVVCAAILEQCNGDESVIYTNLFEKQGLLKNKQVKAVYDAKIKTARNALDRVDRINSEMDASVEKVLKAARSESRKKDTGDIGKAFLAIDISASMESAIKEASNIGAIVAECVQNPEENFHWGIFNTGGKILPAPVSYEQDAFKSILYGMRAGGGTNCLALYPQARKLGCDVDFYITDQGHNHIPSIANTIAQCDAAGLGRPKAVVIVNVNSSWGRATNIFGLALEAQGIPVVVMTPKTLTESALVGQAVRAAAVGATALVEEIMETPLLKLPKWFTSVSVK